MVADIIQTTFREMRKERKKEWTDQLLLVGKEILPYFKKFTGDESNSRYELLQNAPQFLEDAVKILFGNVIKFDGFDKHDLVKIAEHIVIARKTNNILQLDTEKQ